MVKTSYIIFMLIFLVLPAVSASSTISLGSPSGIDGGRDLSLITPPIDVNYSLLNVSWSNVSDYWNTSDEGILNSVFQLNDLLNHSRFNELLWSAAGHTIDTTLDMNNNPITEIPYLQFNTTWSNGHEEGRMHWNNEDSTMEIGMAGDEVNLQVGQEQLIRATNAEASQIDNCKAVYISGGTGNFPDVKLASNAPYSFAQATIGLTTENISSSQKGYVTTYGKVRECNTSGFVAGRAVFLGTNGEFLTAPPDEPDATILLGSVVRVHETEGIILVGKDIFPILTDLSDVNNSQSDLDILQWDESNNVWQPISLETIYYNATTLQLVAGTNTSDITKTQHPTGDYDGDTLNITEQAGSPGLDVRINFTDEIEAFNNGIMRYKTDLVATSNMPIIQLWNYEDNAWEEHAQLVESPTFGLIEQGVFDDDDHVENGVVQMRLYKASSGNTNNDYFIDWLAISKGFGTPAGEEVDPFAVHKDGTTLWMGDDDHNQYNITNVDTWFGDWNGGNVDGTIYGDGGYWNLSVGASRDAQFTDIEARVVDASNTVYAGGSYFGSTSQTSGNFDIGGLLKGGSSGTQLPAIYYCDAVTTNDYDTCNECCTTHGLSCDSGFTGSTAYIDLDCASDLSSQPERFGTKYIGCVCED